MSLTWFGSGASEFDPHPHRVRAVTLMERLAKFLNPYRPYKHYMRGPGPKCREKEADAKAFPAGDVGNAGSRTS
jgi:hypothetical protein